MSDLRTAAAPAGHTHNFLGAAHARNERRAWFVIVLCALMMVLEIVGGLLFGSIALVADGLHMSTHAGALLLAALAYTFARRYTGDPRFSFGTGKLGDIAGFASAIVLAMIAVLIGYEALARLLHPVAIHFGEAIPIAALGLAVNVASAWLLGGGDHHHDHGHPHAHGAAHHHGDTSFEEPAEHDHGEARHGHGAHRDNNMRAAIVHVVADAVVSVLVIAGLILARLFGWTWMDPVVGLIGALVIASWSYGLIRDTGAILLDMNPDRSLSDKVRQAVEAEGDHVADLHLWRLGPGHLGVIVAVVTAHGREASHYHDRLSRFASLSHVTVEVIHSPSAGAA